MAKQRIGIALFVSAAALLVAGVLLLDPDFEAVEPAKNHVAPRTAADPTTFVLTR